MIMPVFKSAEDVVAYIMDRAEVGIENSRDEIERTIDRNMLRYYGEYQPEMYLRTHQLMNSLESTPVIRGGNSVSAKIYIDEGALNYSDKPSARIGNKTKTLSSKPDVGKTLESAMFDGTHGGHEAGGTAIWTDSLSQLKNIDNLLVKELRAAGVPIN